MMTKDPTINEYSATLGKCEWRKWMEAPLSTERAYTHYLAWLRKKKKYRMLRCFECLVPLVYITLRRKGTFPLRDNDNEYVLVSMATDLYITVERRTFKPHSYAHFLNWVNKLAYHFMCEAYQGIKLERDFFRAFDSTLPWADDEVVNPTASHLSIDRRIFLTEELPNLVVDRVLKLARYGMDNEKVIRYLVPKVWERREVSYKLVASMFSLPKQTAKDYIAWVLVSLRRVLYDVREDYSSLMYVEDTPYEKIPDVFTA